MDRQKALVLQRVIATSLRPLQEDPSRTVPF
jgi:hypothetical protein